MTVPDALEERLGDWLSEQGASAFYRDADPPHAFYAYFPPDLDAPDAKGLAAFPGVALDEAETFADEDWLAKSREGFGRIEVGSRFLVKPLWDTDPVPSGRIPVVVNPGLAFGTGGHETTRLCMELLEGLAARHELKGPGLDVGAGTGILALAAYHLGARELVAFDLDPDCGPAMTELMEMNAGPLKGAAPFSSFVGDLEDLRATGPWNLMLANILLETIQELLPGLVSRLAGGGRLIASGILAEREDEAFLSLAAAGLHLLEVRREGAWIAILAERA
ncbi:MAG TPA: 50S ribosomal protein L11 methyltransferase [Holophagaceae bacterium]|jgi:ribosomal protein L11 methyltransferase|nr:50S ribosomal protein L11 methyltransferase [Holophagaceae bacterium]